MQSNFAQRAHEKETAGSTRRQVESREGQPRPNKGGSIMPKASIKIVGTNFVPDTNSVPETVASPASLKKRFALIIGGLSVRELSDAADTSTENAKAWKAARQFPYGETLFRLGRAFKEVREFVEAEMAVQPSNPARVLTAAIFGLQQTARESTAEGAMARALLKEITKGRIS